MTIFTFRGAILFIGIKARKTIADVISNESFRNITMHFVQIHVEAFDFGIKGMFYSLSKSNKNRYRIRLIYI